MIQKVSSGSPWEDVVGYSRAIRVGNIVEVAGTTAMDGDVLIGKDDVYEQTLFIFKKIEKALLEVGATLKNVIRTRMYVTNIDDWEQVGKAHAHYFSTIKPVATMVQVSKLIHANLLVEIEVTAIID
jgi:enamine deaminase RidA (YjgF/YER057c/UK114 family)